MANYQEERRYNQLLQQFNRLKSNLETVSDEFVQKKEQWQKKEAYYDNLIKHARMLCEEILAKDKNEMTLGGEYSWSSVDVIDLLDKAYYSYIKYNKERTELMSRIADLAEERGNFIQALQEEIIHLKHRQSAGDLSEKEIEELAAYEKENTNESPKNHENDGITYTSEDDVDFTKEDKAAIDTIENINESFRDNTKTHMRSGRIFSKSSERIDYERKAKKNAIMTHTVNMEEMMNQIKETGWEILKIIGEFGICERSKITAKILKDKAIDTTESKINTTYKSLINMGLIESINVKLPLQPNMCIHDLTANGSNVYFVKFGANPVISERMKIISEHDNVDHGYGIKELLDVLKEKHIYKDLSMYTRKKSIDLGSNGKYIPDIMGTYNKMPVYFEYERGTHMPKDFEAKLNKAILASKIVNIVAPNIDTVEKSLLPKIERYIESKNAGSLKNVVIRVSTIKAINNPYVKLIENSDWQYVYDLNKGTSVKRNSIGN